MKYKSQAKSRILEAVHETAADLHSAGFISKCVFRTKSATHSDANRPPVPKQTGQGYGANRPPLGDRLN